MLFCFAFVLY